MKGVTNQANTIL